MPPPGASVEQPDDLLSLSPEEMRRRFKATYGIVPAQSPAPPQAPAPQPGTMDYWEQRIRSGEPLFNYEEGMEHLGWPPPKEAPPPKPETKPATRPEQQKKTRGPFVLPAGVTVPKSNAKPLGTIVPVPNDIPGVRFARMEEPFISSAVFDALRRAGATALQQGYTLEIYSAYRSVAHQTRLWQQALKRCGGSEEKARKGTAKPGGSPHHTGGAIDVRLVGPKGQTSKNTPALRKVLAQIMLTTGWTQYVGDNEYWHFEYGTPRWSRGPGTVQP